MLTCKARLLRVFQLKHLCRHLKRTSLLFMMQVLPAIFEALMGLNILCILVLILKTILGIPIFSFTDEETDSESLSNLHMIAKEPTLTSWSRKEIYSISRYHLWEGHSLAWKHWGYTLGIIPIYSTELLQMSHPSYFAEQRSIAHQANARQWM